MTEREQSRKEVQRLGLAGLHRNSPEPRITTNGVADNLVRHGNLYLTPRGFSELEGYIPHKKNPVSLEKIKQELYDQPLVTLVDSLRERSNNVENKVRGTNQTTQTTLESKVTNRSRRALRERGRKHPRTIPTSVYPFEDTTIEPAAIPTTPIALGLSKDEGNITTDQHPAVAEGPGRDVAESPKDTVGNEEASRLVEGEVVMPREEQTTGQTTREVPPHSHPPVDHTHPELSGHNHPELTQRLTDHIQDRNLHHQHPRRRGWRRFVPTAAQGLLATLAIFGATTGAYAVWGKKDGNTTQPSATREMPTPTPNEAGAPPAPTLVPTDNIGKNAPIFSTPIPTGTPRPTVEPTATPTPVPQETAKSTPTAGTETVAKLPELPANWPKTPKEAGEKFAVNQDGKNPNRWGQRPDGAWLFKEKENGERTIINPQNYIMEAHLDTNSNKHNPQCFLVLARPGSVHGAIIHPHSGEQKAKELLKKIGETKWPYGAPHTCEPIGFDE